MNDAQSDLLYLQSAVRKMRMSLFVDRRRIAAVTFASVDALDTDDCASRLSILLLKVNPSRLTRAVIVKNTFFIIHVTSL